jgi:hypothetical protein
VLLRIAASGSKTGSNHSQGSGGGRRGSFPRVQLPAFDGTVGIRREQRGQVHLRARRAARRHQHVQRYGGGYSGRSCLARCPTLAAPATRSLRPPGRSWWPWARYLQPGAGSRQGRSCNRGANADQRTLRNTHSVAKCQAWRISARHRLCGTPDLGSRNAPIAWASFQTTR